MKNYKKILKQIFLYSLIVFLSTIVNTCVKSDEDQIAYYSFEEEDYDKLLNFEENQIIKFQNNSGELVEYKAKYLYGVKRISTLNWIETLDNLKAPIPFPESNFIYFDTTLSNFYEIENGSGVILKYRFSRFPKDVYLAQKNSTTEYPSDFIGQIYFKKWNALENTRIINIDFNATTTSMSVNGVNYDNVYTIDSGNPNVETCGFNVYNVNRVYYDLHSGIIGYDEVDGIQWRLTN